MFPEKIKFDGENYRTTEYNKELDLIFQETNKLRGKGKEKGERQPSFSSHVPLNDIFSNSFLHDLDLLWELHEYIPDPSKSTYRRPL